MLPDFEKLAKAFADTPNIVIGQLDCAGSAQSTCGQYQIQGYPSLKIVKDGKTSDYNGARDFKRMKREIESKLNPLPACSLESKAFLSKGGGQAAEKIEQLLSDADWRAHCKSRTCIVAFLPHILNDTATGRNEKLKILGSGLQAIKKSGKSMGFLWSQGGDQPELEQKLGFQFGFPAMLAVNFGKNRFGIHRGSFSTDQIAQFLTSLSRGNVPLAHLPVGATAVTVSPWDGNDVPVLQEAF
jgi:protein disulfide-isomerase A6